MNKIVLCVIALALCAAAMPFPDIDEKAIIAKRHMRRASGRFSPARPPCDTKVTMDITTMTVDGALVEYESTSAVYGRFMMHHSKSKSSDEEYYEIIRPDMPRPGTNDTVSVFLGNSGSGEKLCYFFGFLSSRSTIDSVIGNFYQMVTMNRTYVYKLEVEYHGTKGHAYVLNDAFDTVLYADMDGRVIAIKESKTNYSISYGTAHRADFTLPTSYEGCKGPQADIFGLPNDSFVFCAASTAKTTIAAFLVLLVSVVLSVF